MRKRYLQVPHEPTVIVLSTENLIRHDRTTRVRKSDPDSFEVPADGVLVLQRFYRSHHDGVLAFTTRWSGNVGARGTIFAVSIERGRDGNNL